MVNPATEVGALAGPNRVVHHIYDSRVPNLHSYAFVRLMTPCQCALLRSKTGDTESTMNILSRSKLPDEI